MHFQLRRRLLLLLLTLAALGPLRASRSAEGGAPPLRPNVLFIAIDDLNDWIGCLNGHPQAKTPHMDRLAARGVLFTNAHCQAPLCNPSRASLLSGLRPSTTGVYALDPWIRSDPKFRDIEMLPQHFSKNGYRTLTAGKIFHDAYPPPAERRDGNEFDVWGYRGSAGPLPPRKFVETPDPIRLMDWGVYPEKDELQEDYKIASWAVNELRRPQPKPFFMSVGFRRPHVPCYAGQEWFDLYPAESVMTPPMLAGDREDTPRFSWYLHWLLPEPRLAWMDAKQQTAPLVRAYLASTSFVDSQVGRLLYALEDAGLAENTLVVLWSDHGYHLGEKQITGKNSLWERSTRVPLILAGPGIGAGRCAEPAELLDLYPTLSDLCGLKGRPRLDGHSLAPQLRNPAAARPWPAITTHGPNNHSVRDRSWRYIRYADGSEELYDLSRDPNEWVNLAGMSRFAARKKEMARHLPRRSRAPMRGSKVRLVERKDGAVWWQGELIRRGAPIPDDL